MKYFFREIRAANGPDSNMDPIIRLDHTDKKYLAGGG